MSGPRSSGRGEKVLLKAKTEERVKAVLEVDESKLIKRGITLRLLDEGEPYASGKEFRIEIGLKNGIDSENARRSRRSSATRRRRA